MIESPGVSVMIPVFNGSRFLGQTIDSVLAQKWQALEILVVDDGSSDDSAEIAEGYGSSVRCIRRSHAGIGAARNVAIAESTHSYLLPLDSDDLLTADSIQIRMQQIQQYANCELLVGCFTSFGDFDSPSNSPGQYVVPQGPQRGHVAGTSLIQRSLFDKIGRFDESLTSGCDLEWFMRCKEQGIAIQFIDNILMRRRIHGRNHSLQPDPDSVSNRLKFLKRSLERKKKTDGVSE
ncbi:MAG: glycosyltransferase [Pirellulaceae bacterium]|nr:glycosyltransferase [Pirellulaceae bacterium]